MTLIFKSSYSKIKPWIGKVEPFPVFFAFISAYALWYICLGEIIPLNDGLGADGYLYGSIVKNPSMALTHYFAQRIIPSHIVHFLLVAFHKPLVDINIIKGFQIYNTVLLLSSAWLWNRACRLLNLSLPLRWLTFVSLFINYCNLKHSFYYPVLTDTSAFFLGTLMLYCYLSKNLWGVLMTACIGAFTWPICIVFAAPIFMFNAPAKADDQNTSHRDLSLLISLSFAFLFSLKIVMFSIKHSIHYSPLECLGFLAIVSYLFYGTKVIFENLSLQKLTKILRSFALSRFIVLIIFALVDLKMVHLTGHYSASDPTLMYYFYHTVFSALKLPFLFIVGNAVYFGPMVICAILLWGPICKMVRQEGIDFQIFFFLMLFISIEPESRHQILALPFLVAYCAKALQQYRLSCAFYAAMIILSVIASKFFLIINKSFVKPQDISPYYLMNNGAYMSLSDYSIQGIIVLLAGVLLYILLKPHEQLLPASQ